MSYLSFYSAAGGGEGGLGSVTVAVQDFSTGSGTGSKDFTTTALTGVTPKAAIVFANTQLVSGEPGATGSAQLSITACTEGSSGNGWGLVVNSYDNQGTTSLKRVQFQGSSTLRTLTPAGSPWQQQGDVARISGGISLNLNFNAAANRMFYIAFAGDDVSAQNDTTQITESTISVASDFEPDLLFVAGVNYDADNSVNSLGNYTIGFALNDGTQRCVIFGEPHGAADGSPLQAILTNRVAGQIEPSTGALTYGITAGNFSGTGFDLTPTATASGDDFMWVALNLQAQVALVDFTTPTSTGSQAITGIGFEPRFALVILTNLEETDPSFPVSTGGTMSSLSICSIGDEQWSSAIGIDSGVATTNTASKMKETAILTVDGSGNTLVEATLTSFDSDGMTLNYTTVQGAGKKGFILFIE